MTTWPRNLTPRQSEIVLRDRFHRRSRPRWLEAQRHGRTPVVLEPCLLRSLCRRVYSLVVCVGPARPRLDVYRTCGLSAGFRHADGCACVRATRAAADPSVGRDRLAAVAASPWARSRRCARSLIATTTVTLRRTRRGSGNERSRTRRRRRRSARRPSRIRTRTRTTALRRRAVRSSAESAPPPPPPAAPGAAVATARTRARPHAAAAAHPRARPRARRRGAAARPRARPRTAAVARPPSDRTGGGA